MKKILVFTLCGLFLYMCMPVGAISSSYDRQSASVEHLKLPKKLAKKTPINTVNNEYDSINIMQYNAIQATFAHDFTSKNAQVGDEIKFVLKDGVSTEEGTLVLPASTIIVAEICNIEKPKAFNRSGKVYLDFKYVELPDGKQLPIQAKLFGNKDFLSRGKLNGWLKGFGSTFGGSAVGVAAGCGIGIAANAVIIGGFAIGLPVGLAVGGALGLLTPGLNYKAKAGDKVNIQLTKNLNISK